MFIARICSADRFTFSRFSPCQVLHWSFALIQSFRTSILLLRGEVRKGIVATFSSNMWLLGQRFCISYSSRRIFWLNDPLYSSGNCNAD